MVRGIDTFKEFFKGFEDNYVIIGGTACEIFYLCTWNQVYTYWLTGVKVN